MKKEDDYIFYISKCGLMMYDCIYDVSSCLNMSARAIRSHIKNGSPVRQTVVNTKGKRVCYNKGFVTNDALWYGKKKNQKRLKQL